MRSPYEEMRAVKSFQRQEGGLHAQVVGFLYKFRGENFFEVRGRRPAVTTAAPTNMRLSADGHVDAVHNDLTRWEGCLTMRYVARQPIFDRSQKVVGYELLYRRAATGPAGVTDGDQATFSVLYDALLTFGLHSTLQQARGWVNVTPAVLENGGHRVVSPDRVVLEILEDAELTPELVALIAAVRCEGYTVALDDFVVGGQHEPLLDLVDIVKLELPAIPAGALAAHVAMVRRPGLVVLVEKIETAEQFHEAMAAGADLFQGYFFARPQVLATRSSTSGTHAVLAVLARLNDPSADVTELVALVGTDVALAQKVLQSVNSGFVSLHQRVDSLHQAVVLLGAERLRQLVTLVLLSGATGKAPELGRQALIRAEMASELVVGAYGGPPRRAERNAAFTVGLMSALDAFTDLPLPEIAARLSLTDGLYDALVHHTGPCGRALNATLAYETDTADEGHYEATVMAYLTAVRRADERWAAMENP